MSDLQQAYEALSAEFTAANRAYNRALAAADGESTTEVKDAFFAMHEVKQRMDDAYQAVINEQAEGGE